MTNPDERILRFCIKQGDAGKSLSEFLSARFLYHTNAEWIELIAAGSVLVNGAASTSAYILTEGDSIQYCVANAAEPFVDEDVNVVFEDKDIIVLNKTGNLPVHPGGRYFNHTLWKLLKDRFRISEPVIINRLDRETSGITLVAKNQHAARICRQQFAARTVTKNYTVLVEGSFPDSVHSCGYLGPDTSSAIRKKQLFSSSVSAQPAPDRQSEWADTTFKLERHLSGICIVRAIPHTGRLHQIRATLRQLGYPVVGDKMYGLDENIFLRFCKNAMTQDDFAKMRMSRQALHASELTFRHPIGGRIMALTAELPKDMREIIQQIS